MTGILHVCIACESRFASCVFSCESKFSDGREVYRKESALSECSVMFHRDVSPRISSYRLISKQVVSYLFYH